MTAAFCETSLADCAGPACLDVTCEWHEPCCATSVAERARDRFTDRVDVLLYLLWVVVLLVLLRYV